MENEGKIQYRLERLDRGIKSRSDDIFALSSWRELAYLALPRVLPFILLLCMPLILQLSGSLYWAKVMIILAIIGILAIGWDALRIGGMLSLGQAFFFGIGCYAAGSLNHYFNWPIYLSIPAGTLGGAILGTALLMGVIRLRGIYFAMITLALPLLLVRVIQATAILGGTEGMRVQGFHNYWVAAYLAMGALIICLFGFRRLFDSDWGLIIRGIGQDDIAVMASGINVWWYKVQVLFIVTSVSAFAGTVMAHFLAYTGLSFFALEYSILPVAGVVVGGSGSFAGAVLGASLLTIMTEALRGLGSLRIAFYSMILVISILVLREGIFPYIQRRYQQRERRVAIH